MKRPNAAGRATRAASRTRGWAAAVGLVYLGEHACEQNAGHGLLLERRYVATPNDREGFWVQLHAAAASHGVLNRQQGIQPIINTARDGALLHHVPGHA